VLVAHPIRLDAEMLGRCRPRAVRCAYALSNLPTSLIAALGFAWRWAEFDVRLIHW
jgi:hypothetical protein